MIADLARNVKTDADVRGLANALISHIEQVLPNILNEIVLPRTSAEKHFIRVARLKGQSGFRRPSRKQQRDIAAGLKHERRLDAIREIKTRMREHSQAGSQTNNGELSIAPFATSSSAGMPNTRFMGDFTETFLPITSPLGARSAEVAVPTKDIVATDITDLEGVEESTTVELPSMSGRDVRGQFAILERGRLVELSDSMIPIDGLSRSARQIQIPNSDLYRKLEYSTLLASFANIDEYRLQSGVDAFTEVKLIEALLSAIELEDQWAAINKRRFHLITKQNRLGLQDDETKELTRLQALARERVNLIAPLPPPLSTLEFLKEYRGKFGLQSDERSDV